MRLDAAQQFKPAGTDEYLYAAYVKFLRERGPGSYPDMVEQYILTQRRLTGAVLPPMRVFYIASGTFVHWLTGWEEKVSLNTVSAACTCLMLPLAFGFASRLGGTRTAMVTLVLMVCAPTQVFMARHALIDVTVALWSVAALWALWENLRHPDDPRRLVVLSAVLAVLVLTKENSFFTVVALAGMVVLNRWFRFGTVSRSLLAAAFAGLATGGAILVMLSGGIDRLWLAYQLLVSSAYQLPYAILTGDGPWHRYLYEQMLVSPFTVILALVMLFRLRRETKAEWFTAIFLLSSYALMASVKYGMNLRYTNLWDMPLRFLAASLLVRGSAQLGARGDFALAVSALGLAAYDLRQYAIIFDSAGVYEPITEQLLRAVEMLK